MPKLIVITPTLGKRTDLLDLTIKSIRSIEGISFRHVIVAPVSSHQLIRESVDVDVLLTDDGAGMYSAINQALDLGDWDWFTYINDDDVLLPGINNVLRGIRDNEKAADIYYGNVSIINKTGDIIYELPICKQPENVLNYWSIGKSPLTQQGVCISRRVYAEIGGFDTSLKYAADMDYFCRAALKGFVFSYKPISLAQFRIHGNQLSMDRTAFNVEIVALKNMLPKVSFISKLILISWFYFSNASSYFKRLLFVGFRRYDQIIASS